MLRKLNERIDRFCALHPRFGIPNLMLYIVFGTAVVYVLTMFSSTSATSFLWLDMERVLHGEVWRLITFIFVPTQSNPFLLLISLYFYYFIGNALEKEWGPARFTFYYVGGVLLTILAALLGQLLIPGAGVVGGTAYVNLSMFFAFAMLYPDMRVLLFFIIPVKIKWLAYADAAVFLLGIVLNLLSGNVVGALMPVVALLNFFVFFAPYFHQAAERQRYRSSPRAQQYRRNARSAQRQQQQQARQGYHHKCCVCGKTDTDHPELQFRYCSRCAGYHCYCSDHIFNHVHFTEETNS
ncbi:MAG: rhomboid family intramembrane serine protease [Oscillospiraceae bacterium]